MEKVEMYEVKVTEEVESGFNQMDMSPPKKRKSKAQEESTDKPKKPRSAYLLYYFDVHQIMQQEIPNLPQSEINKRISENWKRLSVAEKGYYLEKAKLEKEGVDISSPSPSKDVPGFRKILPRANYFLLAKGCPSNHLPGGSQPDVSAEPVNSALKGGPPSVTATQEPQFPPLGLTSEMELSEQSITVDDAAEEIAVASHSTVLQGALPSSSSSVSPKPSASSGTHVTQGAADSTINGFKLKGNETSVPGSPHGGTLAQQIQGETTQVVAIIPTQNLLEPKTLTGVSSVGPVMMVSVESSVEQNAKPSYKMSVKTYTRRGRGRCLNPGCSFVYVTRHKPPTCPECGSHLGGKWIPAAKKAKGKEALSKQTPQKFETKSDERCQATPSPAEEGDADSSKTKVTEISKEAVVQRCSKKQHAATAGKPPEGSSTKQKDQTKPLDNPFKGAAVQSQDRSGSVVQKRPVRPILPAYYSTGSALFQIITVPPNKGKFTSTNNKSSVVAQESFSGLKPSTLKQLGQTVPTVTANQDPSVEADGAQTVASLTDRRVNILSLVPFKQHPVSNFDLGLSTARGRGRCKNPSCDYMYKNRHKPAVCPKCGCMLSQKKTKVTKGGPLLDPYQALSPAQKDLQRQSTLQLLRRSLQIPESETELQEILTLIQELNSLQIILVQPSDQMQDGSVETETLIESGWPQFFESSAKQCVLCNYPLFKGGQGTVAGQEDCWLLTETLIHTASLHLKVCLNVQCLALHSFTDLHPGLFNIGNRLLVTIDLFLRIRASIKLGHSPSHAAKTLLDHVPNHPVHALSPEESSQIQELLLIGYWAFECLTVRDYNDMICGVCGVAPKIEIAQRYTDNVLELKNVEFTWPECSVSDEVHVDDFWLTMESEAIEQAAFPMDIPMTRVDASIIAPFIPPLMRSHTVINTEKDKVLSHPQQQTGDPSVLVRLIHDGHLSLGNIENHSEDELKMILTRCGVTITPAMAKNELLASLISLYTLVHGGLSTAPLPPLNLTAGKLSKVCPHKVVCGSKCLVRGETARDHVDLLLSSRYWPPVYVSDCARQVAVCADTQYPDLATQMWGRNQGCFSDPFEKPEFVSCADLQEQPYSADLSLVAENQQVHPITKSSSCWLVHPPGAAQTQDSPSPEHHSMLLCRDLEPYVSLVAELEKKEGKEVEDGSQHTNKADDGSDAAECCAPVNCVLQQPVVFNNTAYYYLYNRLVDFLTSRDIVNQQINQVVTACQPGEVVIRDALYRLGVAKINTEKKEAEEEEQAQTGEASHEVVLPE